MRLSRHVSIGIIHFWKESTVADVVLVTRPKLMIDVVRTIDGVPIKCNSYQLQAFIAQSKATIASHEVGCVCFTRISAGRVDGGAWIAIKEAARQNFVY